MPKPLNAVMVPLQHDEYGRLIVAEDEVAAYRKKGWTPEGEEPETPADPKSTDVTVKEAAEVIAGLESVEAVDCYVIGDERKGVIEAAESRIEELEE